MLRDTGNAAVRARVTMLLQTGNAAWCPVVKLELWNGGRGGHEKKVLRDLDRLLPCLPMTEAVWDLSYTLASAARDAGITAPATDLLIAACAHHHGVELEHADSDFDLLKTLRP